MNWRKEKWCEEIEKANTTEAEGGLFSDGAGFVMVFRACAPYDSLVGSLNGTAKMPGTKIAWQTVWFISFEHVSAILGQCIRSTRSPSKNGLGWGVIWVPFES